MFNEQQALVRLEQLRRETLGETYVWFTSEGDTDAARFLVTFPYFSGIAFYTSCQSVEQLENSKHHIWQGNANILPIACWFISIEAYLNAIIKIACKASGSDFSNLRGKDLKARVAALFDLLQVDRISFYKSGVLPRLEEFMLLRNEIVHDRLFQTEVKMSKTMFCPIPYLANQVDVAEAATVALEIFEAFRFVFPKIDLMPEIQVKKGSEFGSSYGFIKYDQLYAQVLKPFFEQALKKHNLASALAMQPIIVRVNETAIPRVNQIAIVIRAGRDLADEVKPNETKTSIGADLLAAVANTIEIDAASEFRLPGYHRE